MATAKQIFNEISELNPSAENSSSLGSYVSQSSQMVSDSIFKEVIGFLTVGSLAHSILTGSAKYSVKQLWVVAFELEKNAEYSTIISERIAAREAKSNAKRDASKSKLQANKSGSQELLEQVKAAGKKLGDYYTFVKGNKKYAREFFSKKFSQESVNEFLSK